MITMEYSMLLVIDDDGNEATIGLIEYSTGHILLYTLSELQLYPTYNTADGQSYWSLRTTIPETDDPSKWTTPTAGASEDSKLVGYIRRSNNGGELKISINCAALEEVPDKKLYDFGSITLAFSKPALYKVINGERAVTTVISTEGYDIFQYHDSINRKSVFDRKA